MYLPADPERHKAKISDDFIDLFVDKVTVGFAGCGHVGLVPQHFLREFINKVDLYEPMAIKDRPYVPRELTPEEENALAHGGGGDGLWGREAALMPVEQVW